jgi:6-phosphogluconate dehydrogenase
MSRDAAMTAAVRFENHSQRNGGLNKYQSSWRKAIVRGIEIGVPMPAFSTARAILSYELDRTRWKDFVFHV